MAASSKRFSMVGTQLPLAQSPAVASPSAHGKSGEFQLIGTNEQMGRKPILSPSSNPKCGEFQFVGDMHEMSRKAVHGWGNAAKLVMSPETSISSPKIGRSPKGKAR